MYFLVMSPCTHGFIVMSFYIYVTIRVKISIVCTWVVFQEILFGNFQLQKLNLILLLGSFVKQYNTYLYIGFFIYVAS